jgi:hypothetical protein
MIQRWLAVVPAVVFYLFAVFRIVTAFVHDRAGWPTWWGILDVVIAFLLCALVIEIHRLTQGMMFHALPAALTDGPAHAGIVPPAFLNFAHAASPSERHRVCALTNPLAYRASNQGPMLIFLALTLNLAVNVAVGTASLPGMMNI